MSMPRNKPWYFPWVPVGLATAVIAAAALLLLNPPGQRAHAAVAPRAAAGFQTKDKLLLTVHVPPADKPAEGLLVVELVAGKEVLHADERDVAPLSEKGSSQRFELPIPKQPADQVIVRCRLGKEIMETRLADILLVKPHETALSSGQEFYAGAAAVMRCEVHGVKNLAETVPLAHAAVEIKLKDKDGKVTDVYKGQAGTNGIAAVQFQMPKLAPGSYKMEVLTRSTLGEEKLERDIKVKSAPKILLTSDKPLYQPGQVMHLRALALNSYDLTPATGSDLQFEVEDGKGNKVFKRSLKTSDFGIASIDFQLASEVNQGDYQIRATMGDVQQGKTVTVKPYVLPKFKTDVKTDKRFYLPKETINGDLQSDYFFGKPVAGATVKVTASTFDVAFKDFQTWQGKTDANGHVKFEIKLPDYFVGQPLEKGNALVKLEVKVTDTADHAETATRTYPVSNQPVQISLIPEGGRLVPGMENRIFAAAIYPDGTPAQCNVDLWQGNKTDGKPLASLKTNEAGLAEFSVIPKPEQFRPGDWGQRPVEVLGGQVREVWGQKSLFDLTARAQDAKGNKAQTTVALTSEPMGENVVLRLDKAIYKGGETIKVDIRTSAGLPTTYLDVVRSGQTMLTKWLDVKDGRAGDKLDLPPSLFGTLEIHAYQMLGGGEIIRDSRVVYVNPPGDLKIKVEADKAEYEPGKEGKIRFEVTDAQGKPMPAALGVLVVDEAVYALQDMQPGLEKVYFTLQEELLKPKVEIHYRPSQGIDTLVREPQLGEGQQQVAEVLLTAVKPKPPARWDVNPALERRQRMDQVLASVGGALFQYASNNTFQVQDKKTGTWKFAPEVLEKALQPYGWNLKTFTDPFGNPLALENLAKLEPNFSPDSLGRAVTQQRLQLLHNGMQNVVNQNRAQWFKDGQWSLPADVVERAAASVGLQKNGIQDAWGRPIQLAKAKKKDGPFVLLGEFELVSTGPDGKRGTDDDVRLGQAQNWWTAHAWWLSPERLDALTKQLQGQNFFMRGARNEQFLMRAGLGALDNAEAVFAPGLPGAGVGGAGRPPLAEMPKAKKDVDPAKADDKGASAGDTSAAAPALKVREYFPETMFWQPALITDDRGVAMLPLTFADSITTWRLTASASARSGFLGGVTSPLRVFQPFFVDLDLPVNLTRNDEVAFPVAVYNYLKDRQPVKLELQKEDWFELTDGQGLSRSLDLKPGEVTSVKFRIRAVKIGHLPLTVKAFGSTKSDAIRRIIEVVPDGQKVDLVFTDRLKGTVSQTLTIPDNALPDASKLMVKVYPGVMSQVLEGAEGMLRMPGGCFEQTSSSLYPNILVLDYMKRAKVASPAIVMKAENFLNVGYQRLLCYERPGGGFDWFGNSEPLIWLSAYGMHEFHDMAKVYPIDQAVIDRTQKWLLKQQAADGTWSKIGATHGESIERMGDPKLLLTSYVTWALLESGVRGPEVKKAIEFIRGAVKDAENTYILALAANALACHDAKDDSTHEVLTKILKKLESKKEAKKEWQAAFFPAGGQSLTYARGDSMTVETTALTILAMIKNGQFANSVNEALIYLMKSRDAYGSWGSTQGTILALKAIVAAQGGAKQKGEARFTILVDGKEAAKGTVDEQNADVLQLFDLKDFTKQSGKHEVTIRTEGETNLQYQVVGRYFEPWGQKPETKPVLDVAVDYDRTRLSTADLLKAKATLKYNGKEPTFQVIVDLGIPPGFKVDAGDFAEMAAAKKIQKFDVTNRQVTLYLGDVKAGDVLSFEYGLRPKYPIKAKTPATVAYEYYTPANKATAAPVELVVEDKK